MRVILIVGFLVVGAVVLIAANTSAMGIRERIPEIAILKSLGFRRRPILAALLAESSLQGLLGGLLGAGSALCDPGSAAPRPERPAYRGILGPLGGFRMSPASRRGGRRRGARRRHRRRHGPGLERRAHERHRGAAASLLTRSGVAVPLSYNVRNLLVRRWTSAFTAGGIALVVAATMLLSALVDRAQADAGRPPASPTTWSSCARAPPTTARARCHATPRRRSASLTGIARGADGVPLASPELVNQPFMRTADGGRENVLVRGVEPVAFARAPPRAAGGGSRLHAQARRGRGRRRRRAALPGGARPADRVRAAALDRRRHLRLRRHVLRQRDLGRRDRRAGRHAP